jgi:DnaK suppressor protein
MTRKELVEVRARLDAIKELVEVRARLDAIIHERSNRDALMERTPPHDFGDHAGSEADKHLNVLLLEKQYPKRIQAQAAYDRTFDGTYGMCLNCGREISRKRLQAVPWAENCLGCEEDLENNPGTAIGGQLNSSA